mmetsp:Transcript_75997/g.246690  ORF Transcript_75997/g.246690 Transcript_75997/m.246690 type:complete len:237 (-) Transcript_75997:244-954(-)
MATRRHGLGLLVHVADTALARASHAIPRSFLGSTFVGLLLFPLCDRLSLPLPLCFLLRRLRLGARNEPQQHLQLPLFLRQVHLCCRCCWRHQIANNDQAKCAPNRSPKSARATAAMAPAKNPPKLGPKAEVPVAAMCPVCFARGSTSAGFGTTRARAAAPDPLAVCSGSPTAVPTFAPTANAPVSANCTRGFAVRETTPGHFPMALCVAVAAVAAVAAASAANNLWWSSDMYLRKQ